MSRSERRRQGIAAPPAAVAAAALRVAGLQREAAALAQRGQWQQALRLCHQLLALQPGRPDVLAFAGTLAFQGGEFDEAAALYRRALKVRPAAELHYNLANALAQAGRVDEAAAAYRRALALRPDFVPAHHNLGNALQAQGRHAEAVECYRRALRLRPSAAGERDLGIALHELGRLDEAIAAYRRSLDLPDHRVDVLSNLANALLERGDAAAALEACRRYLESEPGNIEARALEALALNECGMGAEAETLIDFDRFLRIVDFAAPPPGYPNFAAFNAALAAHVEMHPTLRVPPANDPKYHNDALEITGELFAPPWGPMAQFQAMMGAAVRDYMDRVRHGPPHPFLEHLPQNWGIACWATRLKGQGHLDPHIHFTGYIGGVYYPLLPDIVTARGADGAGWFELGRPPARFGLRTPPLTRRVQPREGRLLLFPGYFFHNTVPFLSSQTRISVAFDVMRRG